MITEGQGPRFPLVRILPTPVPLAGGRSFRWRVYSVIMEILFRDIVPEVIPLLFDFDIPSIEEYIR
jgi:hypothetical protein